jgi:putative DNA methylase
VSKGEMRARQGPRLVETWFPSVEVSRLVAADRRLRDPVYGVHRWFARRPATLVPATESAASFWEKHRAAGPWLSGASVYDPFIGGGTSLVEAARMGAHVAGRDVDPLAVALVNTELRTYVAGAATVTAGALVEYLSEEVGEFFSIGSSEWAPLHWFWLRRVCCLHCSTGGLMYRDLILARSEGRVGSVVRTAEMSAFCPECLAVHSLGADRTTLVCCGRRRKLRAGTFVSGRYLCAACGRSSTLEQVKPATSERVMVAVEETHPSLHRRIRAATARDRSREQSAAHEALAQAPAIFSRELAVERRDRRPVSHGFETVGSLFTPRQRLLLAAAMRWIETRSMPTDQTRALSLFVTGLLTSNNALCGYARAYGRLAPLFSVRGYSFPAMSIELNPLHPTAGRGTLVSGLRRLQNLAVTKVYRHATEDDRTVRKQMELPVQPGSTDVICGSADDPQGQSELQATICVTDPPYFDYIAYSELSEFFRVWLADPELVGEPLLPSADDAVTSFADRLAACLKSTLNRLASDTPVVFTYHARHQPAWETIGLALDEAGLVATAAWPVLADPGMGAHAGAGNCEWDVVLTCRPSRPGALTPVARPPCVLDWVSELTAAGFTVNPADQESFAHALRMLDGRFNPPSLPESTRRGADVR